MIEPTANNNYATNILPYYPVLESQFLTLNHENVNDIQGTNILGHSTDINLFANITVVDNYLNTLHNNIPQENIQFANFNDVQFDNTSFQEFDTVPIIVIPPETEKSSPTETSIEAGTIDEILDPYSNLKAITVPVITPSVPEKIIRNKRYRGSRFALYRYNDQRLFVCSDCDNIFQELSQLQLHLSTFHAHLRHTHVCDVCGLGFTQKSHLQRHRKEEHLPSREYVCHLCNKCYKRKEHLKLHERTVHLGRKDFECGKCGRRFYRKDHLKKHEQVHGNGDNFTCELCGKAFLKKQPLSRHFKICWRAKEKVNGRKD